MTRHAILNNVEHRDLRIISTRSAQHGDDVMAALTFPAEFRNVQAHYPIVFAKSREGTFTPLALFGFEPKQNLFLGAQGWDAAYVPLMIERQPFLIGQSNNEKVIHIDLDSSRASRSEGELLFQEDGKNTPYLDRAGTVLVTIDQGISATPAFMAALTEYNLLESFALDIDLPDGRQQRFAGFHTVQEERLSKLGGEALGRLHEQGHLQNIFMVIASLSNFRDLVARMRKRDAA